MKNGNHLNNKIEKMWIVVLTEMKASFGKLLGLILGNLIFQKLQFSGINLADTKSTPC